MTPEPARSSSDCRPIPPFGRDFFGSEQVFSRIGDGELGGKAQGLVSVRDALEHERGQAGFAGLEVDIPRSIVITTDVFERFLENNRLHDLALSDLPDDRIALAFQQAELPVEVVGDLRALVENLHTPLAVRSSSLLEDALFRPFAGVYATKMTPNDEPDASARFRRLVEAVKLVWASTYFDGAKRYARAARQAIADERMAVLIQAVVGTRHADRFYPHVSGVGRSYNFYPFGGTSPQEGVVQLALGLGKTIVDGGASWSLVPSRPNAPPPFGSVGELLNRTQLEFWAVHMGRPSHYDPIAETEYLVKLGLAAAEYDGTLDPIASTYDPGSDRLVPGTGRPGPRALTFAPLLDPDESPFVPAVCRLLALCEERLGGPVEIEFAATMPLLTSGGSAPRLGFLQVRPMAVSVERVTIGDHELVRSDQLVTSRRAMGNGVIETIRDVVYVVPETFTSLATREIAAELAELDRDLQSAGRAYVLIGFGRWGSADQALGIPVEWAQIGGARVIVESTLAAMDVEPSQGSHFFHNLTSFRVAYLQVRHDESPGIDWAWLARQPLVAQRKHVRHVRSGAPLLVRVDGTTGRGGVWHAG